MIVMHRTRCALRMPSTALLPLLVLLLMMAAVSTVDLLGTKRVTAAKWLEDRSRRADDAGTRATGRGAAGSTRVHARQVLPLANRSLIYRLAADFGADPTGDADSSDAIEHALAAMWANPPQQVKDLVPLPALRASAKFITCPTNCTWYKLQGILART